MDNQEKETNNHNSDPVGSFNLSANKQPNNLNRNVSIVILSLICVGTAFFAGFSFGTNNQDSSLGSLVNERFTAQERTKDIDFNLFWSAWDYLQKEYVDGGNLTEKDLFYGAMRGLVGATDDPYSSFLSPEEAREFEEDLSGSFEGIGAEIGIRDNVLTIISPLEDMPAIKAGLQAGDKIYAIDGEDTTGISIEAAVKKIRGPKGSDVTLTIGRSEEDKPMEIVITRDRVVVKSIIVTFREEDGVAVIRVANFNGETRTAFAQAVDQVLIEKPKGLILDMRNNPGGYLETAVAMASYWVDSGPIVIEEFGDGRRDEHQAIGNSPLADFKTVVLINQGSASASEIVAGALRDYEKALLVGKKSFGKGSVQALKPLKDGSIMKITTAKWLTPNGSYIHDEGIMPNIEVDRTMEDREANLDPQFDKALEELKAMFD